MPMLDDGRPVVLYNPHVSPHLSSWYRNGRQVLDWFVEHDDHHLIFAPHVMLFERPFVLTIDRLRLDRAGRIDEALSARAQHPHRPGQPRFDDHGLHPAGGRLSRRCQQPGVRIPAAAAPVLVSEHPRLRLEGAMRISSTGGLGPS
ncbi:hypothetical protein ACRAWD_27245 [Caulobacter segnis]